MKFFYYFVPLGTSLFLFKKGYHRYGCCSRPASLYAYEKLAEHHEQIELWLQMPHMTKTQIVRLFAKNGIQTSERSLGRYIFANFDSIRKATMHLLTIAGQQAQVDFGCAASGRIEGLFFP